MAKTSECGAGLYNAEYVVAVLQDELAARNKTQKQLAEDCSVAVGSIGRIFRREVPSLPLILAICDVLDITPDYLLGYMEDPEYIGKLHHRKEGVGHVDY